MACPDFLKVADIKGDVGATSFLVLLLLPMAVATGHILPPLRGLHPLASFLWGALASRGF
jgi:hypothetical protein